ncbi:MAG: DUF1501 domain-containing protein [Planctomycetota bacterium]|jgi:hypothetical protein
MPFGLCNQIAPLVNRRQLLQYASCGFGWLAFSGMLGRSAGARGGELLPLENPLAAKQPHFAAKAKHVIFLCMRGGPSHLDTFDYKPKLQSDSGKPGPRPGSKLLASKFKFSKSGKSGLWISELYSELAKQADQLCFIHSMQTDLPAHPQALVRLHTGTSQFVRPSLGAWTLYGLGTENENLPGFVSITPSSGFGGATNYGSSFLPAIYQGTALGRDNRPIATAEIAHLKTRQSREEQRAELDFLQTLNRRKLEQDKVNPDVEGAIEAAELAFKMQSEMPQVLDLGKETEATKKLYGLNDRATEDFGRKCLLARRMVEAGVRFIEVTHGNWDHHFNMNASLERSCGEIDRPVAGLLQDLKKRGLLDETLVVFSGEFGRTPYAQGQDGRDHNNKAFTLWMAGGGVKGGYAYGKSDPYGFDVEENPVSIHDLHATLLALLGLDHERLTFNHAGRDFRLTDVYGNVVKDVIA